MKILIVLLILAAIVLLVFLRYRRQIMTGIQIWRMFRQMNSAGGGQNKTSAQKGTKKGDLKDTPLVRCEKCGKWVSAEGTVNLGNKTYCSTACLERAARIQSLVD